MKSFMLLLCLAAAEKLDRTYLPPPGSKYSGGIDGDIQAPFEIPKETYSTTLRPDVYKNGVLSPEDTKIEIGINRGVPPRPGSPGSIKTSGDQRPSNYYQSTYEVPTTTTSYAFTTTTTHPPNEAYETTIGHINPVTGLPITAFDFSTKAPSFINPENNYQGNQQVPLQQTQQPGRRPVYGVSQYPATSTLAPTSQFKEQNRPSFIQGQGQDQSQGPGIAPGLIQRPGTSSGQDLSQVNLPQGDNFSLNENQRPGFSPGSNQRPGFSQNEDLSQYQGRYPVNVPGTGQHNFLVPSTSAPGTTFNAMQYGGDLDHGIFSNQNIPFSQKNISSKPINNIPGPFYPGQNQSEYNLTPGQQLQQALQQGPYGQPGQAQNELNQGISPSSQYPMSISQTDELGRPLIQSNNIYKPISTASPTSSIPESNQYFGTTSGSQPSATTVYPTGSYPNIPINVGNQVNPSGVVLRPERIQAESDRNAVILNYENVITPEGFAYSFDTSNGIHADESGTAVDGVKAKGSYSYIGDDGKLYSIVYTADENGFVPHGDHLPTSPPIPEAIRKVIEQAKKDQEDGISDDGTYDEDKYGHMKYQGKKPQRPNKIKLDDEVPERYNNQYTQNNRQKQRPQSGNKDSVLSDKNDYNEGFEEEQSQDEESPINYDNRKKFTSDKSPSKRPGKVQEGINEEYDSQFNDETGDNIGSNRPIERPSGDRRQFGSKFSVQRPDQYDENDTNNVRPGQESIFEENYPITTKTKEKYYIDAHRNKPSDNKSIQHIGEKLGNPQDYKDLVDFEKSSPTDIPPDFDDDKQKEYLNNVQNGEILTQKQGQYSNNPKTPSTFGSFQDRIRPINTTTRPFDQSNIYNYQESSRPGGIDKYLPGKVYSEQPTSSATTSTPISSQYTGSPIIVMQQGFENQPGINYRPESKRPSSNIPISKYNLTEKNNLDSTGSLPVSGEINGSDYKYNSSRGKPQLSTIAAPQDNEYYVNRITEPVTNKHQNVNHPIPGRRPIGNNRYSTIAPIQENEGYQYLPPQRKFEHGSQLSQNFDNATNRPSKEKTYFTKGEVPKPFTTPDASRNEDAPEDDLEYTQVNNKYKTPQDSRVQSGLRPTTPSSQTYEKYNKENGPINYNMVNQQRPALDQGGRYKEEKDKFTTIGSPRRPTYQQIQTTSRPQQFGPTVSVYDNTKMVPIESDRPQNGDHYYDRDGNEITYVPSSPEPSQTTHFEVTQPTTLEPERQRFFPTTTKVPTQRPGNFHGRPPQNVYEQPSQSPYQTTYRPMISVTSGVNPDEVFGTTIKTDKVPFIRPGYSQNQVSSTTYRPAFVPSNTVTEKQITVDNFGRPVPQLGNQQSVPSTTYRPAIFPSNTVTEKQITVDEFGRPIQQLGNQQIVPSTTYRPAIFPSNTVTDKQITFDKFGRPIPQFGNQQVVPSTTYRPAILPFNTVTEKQITVDEFGRPIPQLENQQIVPSTTYRPAIFPSNTVTDKQITFDKFGRPIPNTDLNQQEYGPGASDNIGPSSQESQRPQGEYKPIVDKYGRPLRPIGGSTTEKVFGEDFSGPKQAQKFDPERGYYY